MVGVLRPFSLELTDSRALAGIEQVSEILHVVLRAPKPSETLNSVVRAVEVRMVNLNPHRP